MFSKREKLKKLLSQCTEGQQHKFKLMYCKVVSEPAFDGFEVILVLVYKPKLSAPIGEVIDNMENKKIIWATGQVKRTIIKNNSDVKRCSKTK